MLSILWYANSDGSSVYRGLRYHMKKTVQKDQWVHRLSLTTGLSLLAGSALLATQLYRQPLETVNGLLRWWLLARGVREYKCNLNGVPMHYYCAGRHGTPLVLIHGIGNSAEIWTALLPLLRRDFLVYAPDLPGFGQTPVAPEGVNIRAHVLYLKRFLDALGYPRAILLGNSLGGWIAAQFAATYPERVQHLYLLNSAGLRHEQLQSPYAADRLAAQYSMDRILGYHIPLPAFILDAVIRVSRMPAYHDFIYGYDPREELDNILTHVKTPTTIIWGKRDGLFPLACAYDFHRGITHSRLILLEATGHMPQVQSASKVATIVQMTTALRDL